MTPPSILVADDDLVARDLLVEVLVREGYRVRAARGGEEAIRLAETDVIDLALVDLRMPDVDGLGVLARIRALNPAPPVIILTAFATIETAIDAIRHGAYDYLSKPFRIDEIKLAARRALGAILDETGGNKVRAAEALGIDRRTLYRILERESEEE
jgi:DNA-binding NtrC family response regulator